MTAPADASLPSPTSGPSALEAAVDPELLALPSPPKRERTATVALMVLTALAAAGMALALRGEAAYALQSSSPTDLGDLAALRPSADLANHYVRGEGMLGTSGAIRYGRAAESDSFRLAPIAGASNVWVEIRVPEGFEGPRFVPPSTFAGRLVPFRDAGIRHVGLADSVRDETAIEVGPDAWILIDGTSPRASRWAVALAALFFGFAAWNVLAVKRVLRRVRDREPESAEPAA